MSTKVVKKKLTDLPVYVQTTASSGSLHYREGNVDYQFPITSILTPISLGAVDGYKYIGQVTSFAALRSLSPTAEGARIKLREYAVGTGMGGGDFIGHIGTATDDSGTIAVGTGYYWKRVIDVPGVIDATWFGVTNDGVSSAQAISLALDYISVTGGILRFPSGEINWGTLRKVINYSTSLVSFTIEGMGDSTLFSYDDVPPPTLPAGSNWVKESPLLSFIGNNGTQCIPPITLQKFRMDYSRQVNKGGNTLETLGITHPTPYSLGVWGFYFMYADSPYINRVKMSNIYGDGIFIRKSFTPRVQDCHFYNVSAGNIIARTDGNMASDSNGGAVFIWACVGGVVDGCVAWNQRLYQVHVNSTDNGTDVYGTLCGYIGFWTEYPWDQNLTATTPETAPPRVNGFITTANVTTNNYDNEAKGCTISNCTVYGYTIGIKSEGQNETNITNNLVLNCYLPLFPASTRATISNNFTDMLYCDNRKCPQGGYESIRAHLVSHNYSTYDDGMRRGVEFKGNKCYCTNYPAIRSNRAGTLFDSNMFRFSRGTAFLFDVTINTLKKGVVLRDNTFFIDSTISGVTTSNVAYQDGIVFAGNRFVNNSSQVVTIAFRNSSTDVRVDDNTFEGAFFFALQCSGTVEKNIFDVNTAVGGVYQTTVVFQATARGTIRNNTFRLNTAVTTAQISLGADNIRFDGNEISFKDTGAGTALALIYSESSAAGLVLQNNKILTNPYALPMFYLYGSHYPTIIGNSNPLGAGIRYGSQIYAPITLDRNLFSTPFSNLTTEKNNAANFSSKAISYQGLKMPYLFPVAGGAEGVVYTPTGWKTYGSISA